MEGMKMFKDYLRPLSEEDFVFDDDNDCIFTKLILDDYDWMNYKLQASFPVLTENGKQLLNVELVYAGFTKSFLNVQLGNDKIQFPFDTAVFDSFLRTYLQAHLDNIDDTYAFSGGELMTRFYNEVIQNHGEPTGREFRDIIV